MAKSLLEGLTRPVVLRDRQFYLGGSIGISVYPQDGRDYEALLKNADTAMYRAKEHGRNNYQFYSPEMSAIFRKRVSLEDNLRRALETDQLSLVYQPQMDARAGGIVGVEALARWHHPTLGEIPPSDFIPVAEDSGLIDRLGDWVVREACRQSQVWRREGRKAMRVAVNISPHQLREPRWDRRIAQVLEEANVDPGCLELELTEGVLIDSSEPVRETLAGLSRLGVQLSIDDFGTRYASLGYLKRFSVDTLKIDQSFVRHLPGDLNDAAIVSAIIAIAHTLNLKVIAEGVENTAQLDFLRQQGCDGIQGFLYSHAVPAAGISAMLREAG